MGTKYLIRTSEQRVFPLDTIDYTDYNISSAFEFVRLLVLKRKKIIFVTKWF